MALLGPLMGEYPKAPEIYEFQTSKRVSRHLGLPNRHATEINTWAPLRSSNYIFGYFFFQLD